MSAAVYRNSTPALSIPQTQNTAPVLEYNCLYTHDIRRKAKRWQDGFLRYHTFNKRVMVYDVPRNYIGDTHWTSDEEVADGDELTLDKAGVLVQVAEAVGRTETDLTELRASTKKARGDGSSPARAPQTPVVPRPNSSVVAKQPHQLKHRSLNALLGPSRTPIGKAALPTKSPFELRHGNAENEEWEEGRPPKRQRAESQAAWNVIRNTAAPKAASKELPLWARTSDAAKQRKKVQLQPGQQKLNTREVIDLREDQLRSASSLAGYSSDTLAPLSPPPRDMSLGQRQPTAESSSPAFRTQKVTSKLRDASLSKRATAETHDTAADDTIDHAFIVLDDSDDYVEVAQPRKSSVQQKQESGIDPAHRCQAPKKKGLLCQDQLTSQPKRISSTNTEAAADRLLGAASDDEGNKAQRTAQGGFVEERLAKIKKKEAAAARRSKVSKKQNTEVKESAEHRGSPDRSHAGTENSLINAPKGSIQANDSAVELAELDKMILPPPPVARAIKVTNDNTDASAAITEEASHQVAPTHSHVPPTDIASGQTEPAQLCTESPPKQRPNRRKIGKKEIRASAAACFKAPGPGNVSTDDEPRQVDGDQAEDSKQECGTFRQPENAVLSPRQPAPQPHHAFDQNLSGSSDDSGALAIGHVIAEPGQEYATGQEPNEAVSAPPPSDRESADNLSEPSCASVPLTAGIHTAEAGQEYDTRQKSQEAVLSSPLPAPQPDQTSARHVSEPKLAESSPAKPKRIPGAPMRFTPSPPKSLQHAATTTSVQQTAGLRQQNGSLPAETGAPGQRAFAMPPPPKPSAKSAVRKGLHKTVALNTAASGTATVMLGRPFQPPKQTVIVPGRIAERSADVEPSAAPTVAPAPAEPWSREAFDLFEWRPPGWDEDAWCFNSEGGQGKDA